MLKLGFIQLKNYREYKHKMNEKMIIAAKHYERAQVSKMEKLKLEIWDEFKLLIKYRIARNFRAFILRKTTLNGFKSNIKIQKEIKEIRSKRREKIDYMVKKRYFRYLKSVYLQRAKYLKMADFGYLYKIKKNAFMVLKYNARNKPLTKLKKANEFRKRSLLKRGFGLFKRNLDRKIQKYMKQLSEQKYEMAEIRYNEIMLGLKKEVFSNWRAYAHKKAIKKQKQLRIAMREYFYIWKFNIQMMQN